MQTSYPLSKTQYQILAQKESVVRAAQGELQATYAIILAGHDVTAGNVVSVTEAAITVDVPDAAPAAVSIDPAEGAEA